LAAGAWQDKSFFIRVHRRAVFEKQREIFLNNSLHHAPCRKPGRV